MILDFFRKRTVCTHKGITADMDCGYCPDCGEYIENHWYITRCQCCGIKQKTVIIKGQIIADTNFCRNCGNSSFLIEKLKKINFVDVHYAALIKEIIKNKRPNFIQSWVDPVDRTPKLLPYYKNSQ